MECLFDSFFRPSLGAALPLTYVPINLVDLTCSHVLVSRTKPCMSKYEHFYTREIANGSLVEPDYLDNHTSSSVDTCLNARLTKGGTSCIKNIGLFPERFQTIHNNLSDRIASSWRLLVQFSTQSTFDGTVRPRRYPRVGQKSRPLPRTRPVDGFAPVLEVNMEIPSSF